MAALTPERLAEIQDAWTIFNAEPPDQRWQEARGVLLEAIPELLAACARTNAPVAAPTFAPTIHVGVPPNASPEDLERALDATFNRLISEWEAFHGPVSTRPLPDGDPDL